MPEVNSAVRSTFSDREKVRLAFFSLFRRVIDVETLFFMGVPEFISQDGPSQPWALAELIGMQEDHWNNLARRAHKVGLIAETNDGLWLIQDQVSDELRLLLPLTSSTATQRMRAFVESIALSSRQHFKRVKGGDLSAQRQIATNEANYLLAISVALRSQWPGCILDTLLGLQVTYADPKRVSDWRALITSVAPLFADTITGNALPGMEDMWLVLTSFELGALLRESKWLEAYPRQTKVVQTLEQAATPWLSGSRPVNDEGLNFVERLAGELSRLAAINSALGKRDVASEIQMRSRRLSDWVNSFQERDS